MAGLALISDQTIQCKTNFESNEKQTNTAFAKTGDSNLFRGKNLIQRSKNRNSNPDITEIFQKFKLKCLRVNERSKQLL